MKKLLIVAGVLALLACKKNRTCLCETKNGNKVETFEFSINQTKKEANRECSLVETLSQPDSGTTNCELK
jgi:hypothetical protein